MLVQLNKTQEGGRNIITMIKQCPQGKHLDDMEVFLKLVVLKMLGRCPKPVSISLFWELMRNVVQMLSPQIKQDSFATNNISIWQIQYRDDNSVRNDLSLICSLSFFSSLCADQGYRLHHEEVASGIGQRLKVHICQGLP